MRAFPARIDDLLLEIHLSLLERTTVGEKLDALCPVRIGDAKFIAAVWECTRFAPEIRAALLEPAEHTVVSADPDVTCRARVARVRAARAVFTAP